MAHRFLQIAVIYLFVGALLGSAMGALQNFSLIPVHAHLLLLGWVSLALAGIIYHLYPYASKTLLAKLHFWIHNLALPVFMGSLALYLLGHGSMIVGVIVGGSFVLIGLGVFALNVLINVKPIA